ncbi:MAG: thermonuclease family protein [Acidovorax sp.]
MPAAALLCLVVAIADGDTLTARCHSPDMPGAYRQVHVRIAAIDAPERRQAYGQRSRQNLAQLCFRQTAAITPVDTDRYGRTVAQVRCQGADVSAAQVRAGMAWAYTTYAQRYPQLAAQVQGLEREARAQRQGLWAQPRPLPPWQYRQRHQ